MSKTKIALIQMKMASDPKKNIDHAINKIKIASKKGAKIICLPELFLTKYFCQTEKHANFKLSNLISEKLTLSNIDSTLIDSITFTPLPADISYARIPNGTGPFSISPPTFSSNNNTNFISEHSNIKSEIFPNPFSDRIFIKSISGFYIVDFFGRIIYDTDTAIEKINTLSWSSGVYFLRFKNNLENTKKLIKID